MMTKKLALLGSLSILATGLSGCASVDEATAKIFAPSKVDNVANNNGRVAPLVVPPDFALMPAEAGSIRPQDGAQEQTIDAMFGGPAERSAAERAVSTAGASDIGIRTSVGDPETVTINKGRVTRDIIAAPEGDGQSAQAVAG